MNDTQGMLGAAGLVCGMAALGVTMWSCRRGERWRRLDLAAREVREFESDPVAQRVMTMLEYPRRAVDLGIGGAGEYPTFVDQEMVIGALRVGGAAHDMEFTLEETAIRDMFALFIGWLARFENHIRVGLVEAEDLRFHIARCLRLIGGGRGGNEVLIGQFWRFALAYGHDEVRALYGRYEPWEPELGGRVGQMTARP